MKVTIEYDEIESNDNCGHCGAEHGGTLVKSEWEHSVGCCSDACGLAIKSTLITNLQSTEAEKAEATMKTAIINYTNIKYTSIKSREYKDIVNLTQE